MAVDPSHPFPYISGLSINLAVLVRNPETGVRQFARVKVPTVLPRFMALAEGRYVALEDVIARHLDQLFSGMQVVGHHTFRVTRNEDVEVEEDDAENLLLALEKELLRRKVGRPPVRLEVEDDIDPKMLELLISELDISEREVFHLPGPLDLRGLFSLADIDRAELKYPAFLPSTHPHLAEVETARPADMFAALKQRDVLLHHPYDSFATSVQRFIEQAAEDPQVLAIKQTLYRTSGDSPIIDALVEAAEAGKQVLALVEIKARFDEQANIAWARRLERHGCHVVYGLVGLKTHCKLSMVVRDEPEGLRRYVHIGTGNYNPKTARIYEDMGLLTANPIITEDVGRLFNHLSGMSQETQYRRLLVAPHGIRTGLMDRIENEIAHAEDGRPAGIRIKVNSLVDETLTDALYRASQAGVQVDLWVRGICTMRPGRARAEREHPGAQHPRPVPGAQPAVLVRQRRLAHGGHRLGRPDAPQPGPPGGGAGLDHQPGARRRDLRAVRRGLRQGHRVVEAAARRHLDRVHRRRPGRAAARHAGVPDRPQEPAPGWDEVDPYPWPHPRRATARPRWPPRPSRSWPAARSSPV